MKTVNYSITVKYLFLLLFGFYTISYANASDLNVEKTLRSYGLIDPVVTVFDTFIELDYSLKSSTFTSQDKEATHFAKICKILSTHKSFKSLVRIREVLNNGQMISFDIHINDAQAFLDGRIDVSDFMSKIDINPLTRGLFIMSKKCLPEQNADCSNSQECKCYPNEQCDQDSVNADYRGCVVVHIPSNAYLVGSEYICNQKYGWNKESTDCIPLVGLADDNNNIKPPVKKIRGNLCGRDKEFVITLFQTILERDPYKDEIEDKVYDLDTGMSRKEMVIRFFRSREYREQKKSGKESYRDAFQAVLGREPSAQEISTFPRTYPYMMARELMETDEYRTLCSNLK